MTAEILFFFHDNVELNNRNAEREKRGLLLLKIDNVELSAKSVSDCCLLLAD